ncbi:NAD(P)-binding domain-containing protein [Streptomyces sp. NPDC045431]|uniref:NAD(P)-dependent oxidoreductase n=1 Tax=Streptomyces sp. NPDC045431 TaxID=3155613 RepID=UPI00340AC422
MREPGNQHDGREREREPNREREGEGQGQGEREGQGEPERVTVLGLGLMGTAIAEAFLAAGYRTTVWNRTAAKADALVVQGAVGAATAGEAIEAGDLVVVPLLDAAAVREALTTAAAVLSGRTVVSLANGSPEEAREVAAWVAAQGARHLDGAMMALPQSVATPDAFFLYSGAEEAFVRHRAALEVMATAHYLGADAGLAEIHSLALLGTGYAALTGFLHAAALLDAVGGLAPEAFAPLAAGWLRGMADFLPEVAEEAASGSYANGVSTVDLNQVAVGHLVRLGRTHGVDSAVHEPLKALLEGRAAEGKGAESFSSVFELLRAGARRT